jgi:hypothetical protein
MAFQSFVSMIIIVFFGVVEYNIPLTSLHFSFSLWYFFCFISLCFNHRAVNKNYNEANFQFLLLLFCRMCTFQNFLTGVFISKKQNSLTLSLYPRTKHNWTKFELSWQKYKQNIWTYENLLTNFSLTLWKGDKFLIRSFGSWCTYPLFDNNIFSYNSFKNIMNQFCFWTEEHSSFTVVFITNSLNSSFEDPHIRSKRLILYVDYPSNQSIKEYLSKFSSSLNVRPSYVEKSTIYCDTSCSLSETYNNWFVWKQEPLTPTQIDWIVKCIGGSMEDLDQVITALSRFVNIFSFTFFSLSWCSLSETNHSFSHGTWVLSCFGTENLYNFL